MAVLTDGLIPQGLDKNRAYPRPPQKEKRERESLLRNPGGSDPYITLHLDTDEDSMLLLGWMENGAAWGNREILS